MSVQALGWVLDHSPTRGSDRLVLVSIANHAGQEPSDDGTWEAWPGVDLIRREAGLDRSRTVQDALARLVAAGALERVVNGAPDERIRKDQRPNLYRIVMDHGVTCGVTRCTWCGVTRGAERGDASRPNGVTRDDTTGCRNASPEPSLEPSEEPSVKPTAVAASAAPLEVEALCAHLADRIEAFHPTRARPPITAKWRKDMRLLLERGPLRDEHAEAMTPARARASIDAVFDQLAEPTGRDGFCWAAQIRSPHALRDHWVQLATAFHRLGAAATTPRMRRLASRPGGLRAFAEAAGYDVNDPNSPLALPQEKTS